MKPAILLHNPSAGDDKHSKEHLVGLIKAEDYTVTYYSVREIEWDKFELQENFIVIAGGDGTVRKVAKKILSENERPENYLLALLPMGTANNIAGSLTVGLTAPEVIRSWKSGKVTKLDIWNIEGPGITDFFVEGAGFGVFPSLIREMELQGPIMDSPAKKIKIALQRLHDIILSHEAQFYTIEADDKTFSGRFVLVELLNIFSVGPNLLLNPHAETDDGIIELVLISEKHRQNFADAILRMCEGDLTAPLPCVPVGAREIRIRTTEKLMHADDELLQLREHETTISVSLNENSLKFLKA